MFSHAKHKPLLANGAISKKVNESFSLTAQERLNNLKIIDRRDREISVKQKIQERVLSRGRNSRGIFHRVANHSTLIPKASQSFTEKLAALNLNTILSSTAQRVNQQILNGLTKPTGVFLESLIANFNSLSLLENRKAKKEDDKLKPLP
jgi:hypothetical protein